MQQSYSFLWMLYEYPIIDVCTLLAWNIYVWRLWGNADALENPGDGAVGAQVMVGQLNGTITASTIMLGLVGAYAVFIENDGAEKIDAGLVYAIMFSVLSVAFAVYSLGVVPSKTRHGNPMNSPELNILASIALSSFVIAAIRFALAIWVTRIS